MCLHQPTLYEGIPDYFRCLNEGRGVSALPEAIWESELEKEHGRIARRRIRTAEDIGFLSGKQQRQDIQTISEYRCESTVCGETTITGQ